MNHTACCRFSSGPSVLGIAALVASGLTNVGLSATSLDIASHKARLQLNEPPRDAQHVLAVQKLLVAAKGQPQAPKTRDVVIVGQIGGMPNVWPQTHANFPWYEGQASFFFVDNKIALQFAAYAKKYGGYHNCSSCRTLAARNSQAIAVVNLVDERGEILRIDARELLDLKENQTVVVRGKAKLRGDILVIDANGIHVPR